MDKKKNKFVFLEEKSLKIVFNDDGHALHNEWTHIVLKWWIMLTWRKVFFCFKKMWRNLWQNMFFNTTVQHLMLKSVRVFFFELQFLPFVVKNRFSFCFESSVVSGASIFSNKFTQKLIKKSPLKTLDHLDWLHKH